MSLLVPSVVNWVRTAHAGKSQTQTSCGPPIVTASRRPSGEIRGFAYGRAGALSGCSFPERSTQTSVNGRGAGGAWRDNRGRCRKQQPARANHPGAVLLRPPCLGRTYDISRDSRRFLMVKETASADVSAPQIVVVLNFFNELRRLLARP
jgi:hypothetical protein